MPGMKPPAPSDRVPHTDRVDAWLAVLRTYNECAATLTARLAPLGLSTLQHEILMNLQRTPGLTQQDLSRRCFSAKSGMSMLIAAFERDGIVTRSRAPQDQRAWCISLTDQGAALAQRSEAVQRDVVASMTMDFDAQDLAQLTRMMQQSAARLQEMRAER